MHMHGKYEGELEPTMTFEYELGKGLSGETILNNYSELQNIIREKGMEK